MEFMADTIPAWLLGVVILYTGIAWLFPNIQCNKAYRNIFASAFLIWGAVFGLVFEFVPLSLDIRGFISRTMILIICLSQSIPLTISYLRSLYYAGKHTDTK